MLLKKIIKTSSKIVFFGGAGVSTESGIPDFRSTDGLYNQQYKYLPETILSHNFFFNKTKEFFDFYRNKMIFLDAKPNAAHTVLMELENADKLKAVITQNIDGLHQLAGSKNVLELHGSIYRNYCVDCHKLYDINAVINNTGIPKCVCGGIIKPDVVLYGEHLDEKILKMAIYYIGEADTLIIGGTSLGVYPAAGLISYFKGKNLVLINKSTTLLDVKADLVFHESVGKVLSECI